MVLDALFFQLRQLLTQSLASDERFVWERNNKLVCLEVDTALDASPSFGEIRRVEVIDFQMFIFAVTLQQYLLQLTDARHSE